MDKINVPRGPSKSVGLQAAKFTEKKDGLFPTLEYRESLRLKI